MLNLAIVTAICIVTAVSFGILVLSTPHTTESPKIGSPQHSILGKIAINPVTGKVYVCDNVKGFVYVLDENTDKTLSMIPTGVPMGIAVNPVTNKIYVIRNAFSNTAVSVIDGATDTVIKNINITEMGKKPPEMIINTFPGGKTYKILPVQVAVNPQTNRIYVSDWNYGDGGITVIDGRTDQVIDTIVGLGGGSYGIGVNPDTDRIYVDNVQYGYKAPYQIAVIDGATDKILANVTIGQRGPHGVYTIPAPYCIGFTSAVCLSTDGVYALPGPSIAPLAVNPSTGLIYASCAGCIKSDQNRSQDWIAVINGTTNAVVGTIPLSALDMAINADTNAVYATLGTDPITLNTTDSFRVAVIDGQTNRVTNYLETYNVGFSVAVNSKNGNVYVSGSYWGQGSVSVFNFERYLKTLKIV